MDRDMIAIKVTPIIPGTVSCPSSNGNTISTCRCRWCRCSSHWQIYVNAKKQETELSVYSASIVQYRYVRFKKQVRYKVIVEHFLGILLVIDRYFGFDIGRHWEFRWNLGFGRNRGFGWPKVNRNYCNNLSHILMDFGKIGQVLGGSNSISTKLWVWFLPKHTFQRVFLVTPKTMNFRHAA